MLSPEDYGVFSAVMALSTLFLSPMGAFIMITSRNVTEMEIKNSSIYIRSYYNKINKNLFYLSVFLLMILIIFRQEFFSSIKIDNYYSLFSFYLILIFSFYGTLNYSFLQGTHRFIFIGYLSIIGIVLKILFSYVFTQLSPSLDAVLYAIVTSLISVYLVGLVFINKKFKHHVGLEKIIEQRASVEILKKALPVLIATISLAVMTQLDIVLVNYYFSSSQAGLYAAASVLGKAVLYIPGGLIIVLFPIAAADKVANGNGLQLLFKASLVTFLSCGLLACIYFIFGNFLIENLYGVDYSGAGEILGWYGLAMLPLALVIVAEQFVIARGGTLFSWIFIVFAPLQVVTIVLWHEELWTILLSVGFFGFLTALSGYLILLYKNHSQISGNYLIK